MLDLAAARAAWPGVDVSEADLHHYMDARGLDAATGCVNDLYLACAIVRGDGPALRAFEIALASEVPSAIAYLDGGTALASDVLSAVRERVLGGKIANYKGRGALRGWLRVVAVREALQLIPTQYAASRKHLPVTELHDEPVPQSTS